MTGEDRPIVPTFEPITRASSRRLVLAGAVGGLVWFAALAIGAFVLDESDAIEIGLLIAALSFVLAAIVLALLRAGRRREERRYADGR